FFLDLEINRTGAGQLAVKLRGNVLVARYAQALGLKIFNFGNTDLRTEYNVLQVLYDFEEAEAFEYDDIKQPVIYNGVFEKWERSAVKPPVADEDERSFAHRSILRLEE